jgi:hypothetical protein
VKGYHGFIDRGHAAPDYLEMVREYLRQHAPESEEGKLFLEQLATEMIQREKGKE